MKITDRRNADQHDSLQYLLTLWWRQPQVGVAAYLSQDREMISDYESGDVYRALAKRIPKSNLTLFVRGSIPDILKKSMTAFLCRDTSTGADPMVRYIASVYTGYAEWRSRIYIQWLATGRLGYFREKPEDHMFSDAASLSWWLVHRWLDDLLELALLWAERDGRLGERPDCIHHKRIGKGAIAVRHSSASSVAIYECLTEAMETLSAGLLGGKTKMDSKYMLSRKNHPFSIDGCPDWMEPWERMRSKRISQFPPSNTLDRTGEVYGEKKEVATGAMDSRGNSLGELCLAPHVS